MKGLLVAVEGIDGAGKTAAVEAAVLRLQTRGIDAVATYEPTHGPIGMLIRARKDNNPQLLEALFTADRAEHVIDVIGPGLEQGKVVVTDRYYFSTATYQHTEQRTYRAIVQDQERKFPPADLLIVLDLPVDVAMVRTSDKRVDGTLGDYDRNFVLLAESRRRYYNMVGDQLKAGRLATVVDATQTPEEVAEHVACAIESMWRGRHCRVQAANWLRTAQDHEAAVRLNPTVYYEQAKNGG